MYMNLLLMGVISFLSSCFFGSARSSSKHVEAPASIYEIEINSLDGKSKIKFSDFKGKYIVVVNTASECGYTPQYKDLQEFYTRYHDSNVVLIGCPCNQFGGQ